MFHYKHIKEEPHVHKELLDKEKGEPLKPFLEEPNQPSQEPKKAKRAKVQKNS